MTTNGNSHVRHYGIPLAILSLQTSQQLPRATKISQLTTTQRTQGITKTYLVSHMNLQLTQSEISKKPAFNSASCEHSFHLFIHELIYWINEAYLKYQMQSSPFSKGVNRQINKSDSIWKMLYFKDWGRVKEEVKGYEEVYKKKWFEG